MTRQVIDIIPLSKALGVSVNRLPMPLPDFQSRMLPALDALADGAEMRIPHVARRPKRNVLFDGAELARPMDRYGIDVRTRPCMRSSGSTKTILIVKCSSPCA